jgi:hypothetical protein
MLDKLISAWMAERRLCDIAPPIEFDVEVALRQALPNIAGSVLMPLYSRTASASIASGNTNIHPPFGPYPSVTSASAQLREWKWHIPENVVVFGDNGCGESFGVWQPKGPGVPLIVEIAEPYRETASMSVVGTDLARFLLGRTVYYFLLCEADANALAMLNVPESIRSIALDDDGFSAVARWADPLLPNRPLSPYHAELDEIDLEILSRGSS